MIPISDRVYDAAKLSKTADVSGPSKVRRTEKEALEQAAKPMEDIYTPEEKEEPAGRYWPEKDENGRLEIRFDGPEPAKQKSPKPEEGSKEKESDMHAEADGPDQSEPDRKVEICRGSTDKVDREIEKLKKKREEIIRQLNSQTDERKIKEREGELAQV